jgi:uncharacterized secreted protein with C-terminal beta-propeller domain
MRRSTRLIGIATTVLLIAAACTTGSTPNSSPEDTLPGGTTPQPNVVRAQGSLVQFDECADFLDYVIDHAVELVGPYGFDTGWPIWGFDTAGGRLSEGAAEATPDAAGADVFSTTNVQVEGVDEPDMVKTDGERIVLMSEGHLIVVDVTGDEPVETGRLDLSDMPVDTLFLHDDRVLMFGSVWQHSPVPLAESDARFAPQSQSPLVRIVEVDISDDPEVVRTMTIDGQFVSGRMIGDSVRLILTSSPVGFEWTYPEGSGLRAERKAIAANREIVRNSTEENWIPYFIVSDADGDVVDEGTLFDCQRASHPEDFSGLDMLSVMTIDLSHGLDVVDATGLLATGNTVYSSSDDLYIATQNWQTWRWVALREPDSEIDEAITEIHKFDVSNPARTEYLASGSVNGHLLNQFAMDEHKGDLRVASTTSPSWWGSSDDSESRVTVLREIAGELFTIGMVDGLGETEQIYSVRFMGDVAYVVTFRQTDPLYTVDLSDPRAPGVMGELKINGYSAYLHPISENLVMGIGQDATDDGRILGSQVSIFDVSDLESPTRVDSFTLAEGSNSSIEYDHHAFLYWDGLAMVPIQQYHWDEKKETSFFGAIGLRVSEGGDLTEVSRVVHPGGDDNWDWRAQIVRSIAIGDSIYTVSAKGIMKSAFTDLDTEAWLDF